MTNSLLTLVGDGEDDTITLSVVQDNGEDKIAVNGVATALNADANAEIAVDSGGGADTVSAVALVAGTYKSLVVSGGDGNDQLTGGAQGANGGARDILNGDAGNDTLIGGKGADTANGGEGDDVMIWNNGDASDINNGEAGNDEVVINGNDGGVDVNTYAPDPADANRAIVARTNVGQFTVNFEAEHLTVNGLKGDDTMSPDPASPTGLAGRTSLVVNGGEGVDTITGGDGNDRLVGGIGADTVAGGPGNDTMVWNNGDGSDVNDGGDGDDTTESNGAAGPEDYSYRAGAAAGQVHFERAANAEGKGAFSIDLVAEHLVVNSLAGNDSFEEPAGQATPLTNQTQITVNAGDDEDIVFGSAGNDTLNGDAGNDMLIGAKGADTANGGAGDDLLIWNNGDGSDVNDGGDGDDTVQSNGNDAAGEVYTYRAGAAAGQVHFERANNAEGRGGFSIDLVAEHLLINSLGGDDSFEEPAGQATPLTNQTQITVNAGAGNDTVKGSAGNDTLNGDAGNDMLVGAKGADTANGGPDDDVMVWNNGDASDVNNGGDGNDEAVINGNDGADDANTYKPVDANDAGNVRVLFARTNLVPFTVDLEAEKLTVNGLKGNDTMAPDPASLAGLATRTSIALNGGEGNDTITGGDGNDAISGGDGNDRLVGFKGGDTVAGGNGDDTMVWNNGDGTDVNDGDAGTDTVESNGNNNPETYTYKAEGGRVKFNRTSAGAFGIDLTAEKLLINTLGGDDSLEATDTLGGLTLITVNAGDGNDRVLGSDGSDTISGDGGSDVIDGQAGNDALSARDQQNDLVRGGAGNDSAVTDQLTIDSVSGVEQLDATPPPVPPVPPKPPVADTSALAPTLGKAAVAAVGKKLLVKVPVSCPAAETGGCRTTLTVETAKAARLSTLKAVVVLGSKTVSVGPGGQATASIRLTPGAALLAVNGKLPARIRIASTDSAGNTVTRTVAVTLKVPRLRVVKAVD